MAGNNTTGEKRGFSLGAGSSGETGETCEKKGFSLGVGSSGETGEKSSIWQKLLRFWDSWTGSIIIVLFVIFFIAQAFTIPSGSMKNSLLVGDHLVVKKFSYGVPRPYLPFAEIPLLPDFRGDNHLLAAAGPKRGDVVVFRSVENEKVHFIKRCVGEPGDKIVYAAKRLFVRMHEGDEYMKKRYAAEDLVLLGGELYVQEPLKNPGIHYDERVDFDRVIAAYRAAGKFAMQPAYFAELASLVGSKTPAYSFSVPAGEYFMMGDNRDHSNDSRFWGSVPYANIEGSPWFIYLSWDENYKIRWERMFKTVENVMNDKSIMKEELSDLEALE